MNKMKKYIKLISFFCILSLLSSCDENKNDIIYDDINGQTLLQFGKTVDQIPTPAEGTTTYDVEVYVSTKSDTPRTISLEIDNTVDDAASSDQYTLSNLVIEAGSHVGTLSITTNYDAIQENGSSYLVINLTSIENSADAVILDGTIELEIFRKCPVEAGNYSIRMADSYGDGWQGSKLIVTMDGETQEFFLEDYWSTGIAYPGGENTVTLIVPEGVDTLTFKFVAGDYPEENYYEIYHPNGSLIAKDGDFPGYDVVVVSRDIPFNPCNF